MSFDSLGLRAELLRAIADEGYSTPTPIQLQAIPAVLNGGDILAAAQTGTGKTASPYRCWKNSAKPQKPLTAADRYAHSSSRPPANWRRKCMKAYAPTASTCLYALRLCLVVFPLIHK